MNSEDRDRVSMVAMAGGGSFAVLAVMAGLPPLVWLLLAASGGLGAWYRRDGRHHRSLAEEVESALPSHRRFRVEERPQAAGLLLVLIPSPPLTDPQMRAVVAGPAAGQGYRIVSIRQAKRGKITVTLIELMP